MQIKTQKRSINPSMILDTLQIIQFQLVYEWLIFRCVSNFRQGGEDGQTEENCEAEEDYGV